MGGQLGQASGALGFVVDDPGRDRGRCHWAQSL